MIILFLALVIATYKRFASQTYSKVVLHFSGFLKSPQITTLSYSKPLLLCAVVNLFFDVLLFFCLAFPYKTNKYPLNRSAFLIAPFNSISSVSSAYIFNCFISVNFDRYLNFSLIKVSFLSQKKLL